MSQFNLKHCLALCTFLLITTVAPAGAQIVEGVGSRALGMGGAFVAVANDSSATWWNPGALAAGPFLDISLGRAITESTGALPAQRDTANWWFSLGTPPFGFSYYRLRLTNVAASSPTVTESGSREEGRAGVPIQSLAASQLGVTLDHSLFPGIHVGATLKYVRGTLRADRGDPQRSAGDLLDQGDDLGGGDGDSTFDTDLGLIAVGGPFRAGLLVRNVFESELENAVGVARFDRQIRVGLAYAGEQIGRLPLTVAVDVDTTTTETASGDRRNVAVGAEQWLWNRRLAVRGGGRFNTVGPKDRTGTVGASVALRSGLFVDAHLVRGGSEDDRGWGVAARVSF